MIDRLFDVAKTLEDKTVASVSMTDGAREQYQTLATTLHERQAAQGVKTIVVSSALPGEGKTLTVTNLGLMLSESFKRRVLLVDADFRRPNLHTLFQLPLQPGLADLCTTSASSLSGIRPVTDRLALLSSGKTADPVELLSSPNLRVVLDRVGADFDWVLIDTPPIGLFSDAKLVAALTDGVVLVVSAGQTPLTAAQRAVDAFGRDRVFGAVLNRADQAVVQAGYGYGYGYGYRAYARKRDGVGR